MVVKHFLGCSSIIHQILTGFFCGSDIRGPSASRLDTYGITQGCGIFIRPYFEINKSKFQSHSQKCSKARGRRRRQNGPTGTGWLPRTRVY